MLMRPLKKNVQEEAELQSFEKTAIWKPCMPLGKGIFFPWKSGNWKGALQQWLVLHFYFGTLTLLMTIWGFLLLGALHFGLTRQFWFALTQRKPIGFPAIFFGVPLGIFASYSWNFLLFNFQAITQIKIPGYSNEFLFIIPAFAAFLIVSLATWHFVIERRWLVVALGLAVVALSALAVTLMIFVIFEDVVNLPRRDPPIQPVQLVLGIIIFIVSFVGSVLYFYVGVCIVAVGLNGQEGHREDSENDSQGGKKVVSIGSKSTTDGENPVAGGTDDPESTTAKANPGAGSIQEGDTVMICGRRVDKQSLVCFTPIFIIFVVMPLVYFIGFLMGIGASP
jgi:hypothetical protein